MDTQQETDVPQEIMELAKQATILYRELTGKLLGIRGEVGEVACAGLLDLRLAGARRARYDAVGRDGLEVQIKALCFLPDSKPGGRLKRIKHDHEWDTLALGHLVEPFEPISVHEAGGEAVVKKLTKPGSESRMQRDALGVSEFKSISGMHWERGALKV